MPSYILKSIPSLGANLNTSIPATYSLILPYLKANASAIASTPRKTISYGPLKRQKADLYSLPLASSSSKDTRPIVLFFPGGGLTHGDRLIGGRCEHLIYANLGYYFGNEGFTTIVADYRRVGADKEDAKYPSGGEDVQCLLGYLDSQEEKRPVILFGNSAGGIHVATYLFSPEIQRKGYKNIKVVGAIILSSALDFTDADKERLPVLQSYFSATSIEEINSKSAVGNINSISTASSKSSEEDEGKVLGNGVKIYLADCEFDPAEITTPTERFAKAYETTRMHRDGDDARESNSEEMIVRCLVGHNHVSPCLSLGSGDEDAEKWAAEVVEWMKKVTGI